MNYIRSLYIHFPYCFHLCNYCDFYKRNINEKAGSVDEFEVLLEKQWQANSKFLAEKNLKIQKLDTLYLGGGTPSLWSQSGIQFFKEKVLGKWFDLSDGYEFTMEIDPNTFKEGDLANWAELGVNRVSIGAQGFNNKSLLILDRKHTKENIEATVNNCKKYFQNISLDFMLGIPDRTLSEFEKELDDILKLDPDHMSVYMLTTRSNYPHKDRLPPDDQTASEYEVMVQKLEAAGLMQYEVSNFAKSGKKSKHNLEYWKCGSVAGIGPSATGLVVQNDSAIRYKWKVLSDEFQIESLTPEQWKIEYVYMNLRSELGLDLCTVFHDQDTKLKQLLINWNELGYLKNGLPCTKVQLTFKGYLMLDSIMGDLFGVGLL